MVMLLYIINIILIIFNNKVDQQGHQILNLVHVLPIHVWVPTWVPVPFVIEVGHGVEKH